MKHEVVFDLPTRVLGKTDIHFTVRADGELLGKLEISQGALVWYPKRSTLGHKIRWAQFDELAQEFPRRERRKQPSRRTGS
jgi:hypothetical protein